MSIVRFIRSTVAGWLFALATRIAPKTADGKAIIMGAPGEWRP